MRWTSEQKNHNVFVSQHSKVANFNVKEETKLMQFPDTYYKATPL